MSIVIGVVLKPDAVEALDGLAVIREEVPDALLIAELLGHHALDDLPSYVERVDAATFERRCDLVVVFGGDGTLIHAASLFPERVVPILGVNLGRIGFLAEVTVEELRTSLGLAVAGKLPHSDRMRLDVEVRRQEEIIFRCRILNDAVLSRQAMSRIATFRVFVGNDLATSIRGDGVIIATPTGSTAYSLAAGGSILVPELEAIAITPISPYQLTQRPLVMKPVEDLRLMVVGDGPVYATCDGQDGLEFRDEDVMTVRRAAVGTRILSAPARDYFETLRVKLRWGDK